MKNILLGFAALLVLSIVLISTGCKSKDPDPDPAGPSISVTIPTDNTDFQSGESISLSAVVTSGSNLKTLTATVTYKTALVPVSAELRPRILKSLTSIWAPQPVVVTLNETLNQSLINQTLYNSIDASASSGNYVLGLVVEDVAGRTVTKDIPFKIL